MTPPTPAAVRYALRDDKAITEEERNAYHEDPRMECDEILSDHIRAVAQEMRELAAIYTRDYDHEVAGELNAFADKLEGKQNERGNV